MGEGRRVWGERRRVWGERRRVCGGGEESVGEKGRRVWGRGGVWGEGRRVCKKIWRWGWNGEKEIHVLE